MAGRRAVGREEQVGTRVQHRWGTFQACRGVTVWRTPLVSQWGLSLASQAMGSQDFHPWGGIVVRLPVSHVLPGEGPRGQPPMEWRGGGNPGGDRIGGRPGWIMGGKVESLDLTPRVERG